MRLPSALFLCGTLDCLLDDSVMMSAKWGMSGAESIFKAYPGEWRSVTEARLGADEYRCTAWLRFLSAKWRRATDTKGSGRYCHVRDGKMLRCWIVAGWMPTVVCRPWQLAILSVAPMSIGIVQTAFPSLMERLPSGTELLFGYRCSCAWLAAASSHPASRLGEHSSRSSSSGD